ncbi:MAG: DUF420 domain-containing protein [Phycisphaeraceae bacterium]|nr:DUF420 domain-containing protein [Phycisphaeraceae bacterium]
MKRRGAWIRVWAAAMVIWGGAVGAQQDGPAKVWDDPAEALAEGELPVLGEVGNFVLTDQDGAAFGLSQLKGQVWVADFVFTRCQGTCPAMTMQMGRLQGKLAEAFSRKTTHGQESVGFSEQGDVEGLHPLPASPSERGRGEEGAGERGTGPSAAEPASGPAWGVKLISFSVDPGYDRPEVLREYAQANGADPGRWRFLTGTREEIWELCKASFMLGVGEDPGNVDMPVFHSTKFVLVDQEGKIRGYYDGLKMAELERLVKEIGVLGEEGRKFAATSRGAGTLSGEVSTLTLASPSERERGEEGTYGPPAKRGKDSEGGWDLSFLPGVNAALNGTAAVLLAVGWVLIKRKKIAAHRAAMLAAFGASSLFLICYVAHYVWRLEVKGGMHTKFVGPDWLKAGYYAMLISHILLAMAVPVLAVTLIVLGLKRKDAWHRRIARVGFPLWMYVSVTGVLIYLLLYHWNGVVG